MRIYYDKKIYYEWAEEFLRLYGKRNIHIQKDSARLEMEIGQDVLARLLQRINDSHKAVILPSLASQKDHRWLIAATTFPKLEQALARVRSSLIPTYTTFDNGQAPVLHSFTEKAKDSRLHQIGGQIYPDVGYYVLKSRPEDFERILQRLDVWMKLEGDCPPLQASNTPIPTYGSLYERFRRALATAQWDEAKKIRQTVQNFNLTTADNLLFLEVEQLAFQQRWREISEHKDIQQLVRLRVPRAVRGALLTAFHRTVLFPLEQEGRWQDALYTFQERLPQLGLLLTGRLGLTQGPVVQIFAYQAAVEHDRKALLDLLNVNKDLEVLECIKHLLDLLGPQTVIAEAPSVVHSSFSLTREALDNCDYDAAARYAMDVANVAEKAFLLMQIAFDTSDATQAENALLSYRSLSPEQQDDLRKRFPVLKLIQKCLEEMIDQHSDWQEEVSSPAFQQIDITDWIDWFIRLGEQPNDPVLTSSLERLVQIADDRFWTIEHVAQLGEQLMILDQKHLRLPHVRDAIQRLTIYFLSEDAFPKREYIYQDLYESFYVALLAKNAHEEMYTNFTLLRLATALLEQAPSRCDSIFQNFKIWSGKPIAKLEAWILEVFELLIDYGLEPSLLAEWYRDWISQLSRIQIYHKLVNLEGWLSLGKIIQPGEDLMQMLQQKLKTARAEEIEDPIKDLTEGYRIGIYSLQESAAQRAKALLLERNPGIEVRICTDMVFSDSARAIARNSNLTVLVTTAMKHALSCGITSFLDPKKVVYPQSSGSTSIVREIERYLSKTENQQ